MTTEEMIEKIKRIIPLDKVDGNVIVMMDDSAAVVTWEHVDPVVQNDDGDWISMSDIRTNYGPGAA